MIDISIEWDGSPELLAQIGEVLGAAGVNIEGLCVLSQGNAGIVHFVVEDASTARGVLESAEIRIKEMSEVYVLHKDTRGITGRPGSFGGICRALAENGIGIRFGYPAENNRFILGVSDVAKTRALLG